MVLGNSFCQNKIKQLTHAVGIPKLALERIKTIEIRLPPLEIQNAIVEQIEKEQAAIDEYKKLIEMHEAKIKTKIAEVWGVAE